MMPLSLASEGQVLKLVSIRGGLGVQKRLTALGLTPGTEVTIITQNYDGPLILAVKGSRLAIGRGLSYHILVETQNGCTSDSAAPDQSGAGFKGHHHRGHKRYGHHHG